MSFGAIPHISFVSLIKFAHHTAVSDTNEAASSSACIELLAVIFCLLDAHLIRQPNRYRASPDVDLHRSSITVMVAQSESVNTTNGTLGRCSSSGNKFASSLTDLVILLSRREYTSL